MPLRCGIVGLPNAGKSTLFNLLTSGGAQTGNYPFCTIDPNVGVVEISDDRLDRLAEMSGSARTVPATVEFTDIAGLVRGASEGEGLGNKFLSHIRETDAIVHVVRCFLDKDVAHVSGMVDPVADVELVDLELALADLATIDKAVGKAEAKARTGDALARSALAAFGQAKARLEAGVPLRRQEMGDREMEILSALFPLTLKPVLYAANCDLSRVNPQPLEGLETLAAKDGSQIVVLDAKLEDELAALDQESRRTFLDEYGIESSGLDRLAKAAFDLLGLQVFFTSGPKESRAWVVPKGTDAARAAGVIHTDMQDKFIKAEVVSYGDFVGHGGLGGAKDAGKLRQEGRGYGVQDGDILHIKFGA